ncbi:hypothetical protein PWT90_04166 [Aphanocladium album]|nr:hypothetical protein PWT90_04166 [Aphanocladium album]
MRSPTHWPAFWLVSGGVMILKVFCHRMVSWQCTTHSSHGAKPCQLLHTCNLHLRLLHDLLPAQSASCTTTTSTCAALQPPPASSVLLAPVLVHRASHRRTLLFAAYNTNSSLLRRTTNSSLFASVNIDSRSLYGFADTSNQSGHFDQPSSFRSSLLLSHLAASHNGSIDPRIPNIPPPTTHESQSTTITATNQATLPYYLYALSCHHFKN